MNEQMTLTQSFLFISDAGHGWLKVPLTDLALLGIEQEISPYSYVHQGYVYLEEDCDYLVYMTAYHKATPVAPTICEEYSIGLGWRRIVNELPCHEHVQGENVDELYRPRNTFYDVD